MCCLGFVLHEVTTDRIPPIIRRGPVNQTLAIDSTALLQCHVTGNPLPSIQWLKDGQRIMGSDPRMSLLDNGTLQITNLQVRYPSLLGDLCNVLPPPVQQIHQNVLWVSPQFPS